MFNNNFNFNQAFNYNLNFNSAFKYSSVPTYEDEILNFDVNSHKETTSQHLLRILILSFAYFLIILTLPISLWFSIKKIKSLERCLIYRLGKRLPLKGPGLVFVIPCVDVIDYIDLNLHDVNIARREQILTNDGSLIEIIEFNVQLSVLNAIQSSTHLKDSNQNVIQFTKLSFLNLISSTHLDDLEYKMEYVVKLFVQNCNCYLNKWGWSLTYAKLPSMVILSRAEPNNSVISTLKSIFEVNPSQISSSSSLNPPTFKNLMSNQNINNKKKNEINEMKNLLQTAITKFQQINLFGFEKINILVELKSEQIIAFYQLDCKSGLLDQIEQSNESEKIHLELKAETFENFKESIQTNDISKIEINKNFF